MLMVFCVCPKPGSNRHVVLWTLDFESSASTDSAIRADRHPGTRAGHRRCKGRYFYRIIKDSPPFQRL